MRQNGKQLLRKYFMPNSTETSPLKLQSFFVLPLLPPLLTLPLLPPLLLLLLPLPPPLPPPLLLLLLLRYIFSRGSACLQISDSA
jgi:hypothetical protein